MLQQCLLSFPALYRLHHRKITSSMACFFRTTF